MAPHEPPVRRHTESVSMRGGDEKNKCPHCGEPIAPEPMPYVLPEAVMQANTQAPAARSR